MKKILLLLIATLSFAHLHSQEDSGIYYNGDKLGYSRVIGKNVGNLAGAYFTLGLSAAKSNKVIEGESAELEIEKGKPEFEIIFGEDNQTDYIFTDEKNMDNILLIQLLEKKNNRNLRTGKYGLTGVKIGVDEKYVIPLAIEKIEPNKYKVHPKKKLGKGEYCFYYMGKPQNEEDTFNGVFDFSIK